MCMVGELTQISGKFFLWIHVHTKGWQNTTIRAVRMHPPQTVLNDQ